MGTLLSGKRPSLLLTLVMAAIALFMIFPFLWMLSTSFKTQAEVFDGGLLPGSWNLDNYTTVLHTPMFLQWYRNSFLVVSITMVLKMAVVVPAAYAFAKLNFKGREAVFLMLLSSIMITADTTVVARYMQYKYMELLNTMWVLIVPGLFDVYFVFLMRQFFKSLPGELMESGLIDGASHVGIFMRIMVPLAKSPVMTMVLFTFIWGWNDFMGPFLFITSPQKQMLSVGLNYFQSDHGTNYALTLTAACLAIIPVIFAFSLVQRYFVEGIASTGIKG